MAVSSAVSRNNPEVRMRAGSANRDRERRRGYLPLFGRIVLANAVVLLAACFAIFVVLSPSRISEFATDEVLIVTLCVVTVGNIFMVRRVVAPVQELTALARQIDPAKPGARFPGAGTSSEAGELALAFNEMLARLEEERAESARSVLAAHESERLRVAQELHDEVGQTLTAVLLELSRVQGRVEGQFKPELVEAQEAVRASLEDVRRIASELRPETLADLGLASALTTLGASFGRRTGIDVRQRIQADLPSLKGMTELAVYRVAQEALTNVARHSGSDRAELTLSDGTGQLTLTVRDYGHGLGDRRQLDGNGLRGMRERAAAVGGKLKIGRPAQGPGTDVTLDVPLAAAP
jgi:two-component system sensor histidine kinase UhpB